MCSPVWQTEATPRGRGRRRRSAFVLRRGARCCWAHLQTQRARAQRGGVQVGEVVGGWGWQSRWTVTILKWIIYMQCYAACLANCQPAVNDCLSSTASHWLLMRIMPMTNCIIATFQWLQRALSHCWDYALCNKHLTKPTLSHIQLTFHIYGIKRHSIM